MLLLFYPSNGLLQIDSLPLPSSFPFLGQRVHEMPDNPNSNGCSECATWAVVCWCVSLYQWIMYGHYFIFIPCI